MAANQFLAWATGVGANVYSYAAYAANGALAQGVQAGVADPTLANTTWRQASVIACMIAQFTADHQGSDVNDDGNVAGLEAKFLAALQGSLATQSIAYLADTGTADALAGNSVPTFAAYATGQVLLVKKNSAANATASPVLTANGIGGGGKTIVKKDGTALAVGDLPGNSDFFLGYDGTSLRYIGQTISDIIALVVGNTPIYLQASQNYFVNASTGSDSNDGLTSGTAFQTLQKVVDTIAKFNLNGFNVTVTVASGTYASVRLKNTSGSGSVIFNGNTGTPTNCSIVGTSVSAINAGNCGSAYTFNGFKVSTTGAFGSDAMYGVVANGNTQLSLNYFNWGVCNGGHMAATNGGQIALGGTMTISGGCAGNALGDGSHMRAYANSQISNNASNPPSMTISSAITLAGYFAESVILSFLSIIYTSITNPGNVTGTRYLVSANGVLTTGGGGASYYPGTIAGSAATGGQYS